jgi:oligopeptide/dipeptide ABC transporter ATP-binding protein
VVSEVTDRVAVMYAGQIVEEGTVPGLFEAPAHPYTRGLLASIPDPDRPGRRLRAIPGTVPPPGAWPAGCRFRPRCPHAWERCAAEPPSLLETDGGRARCWLVEEPERAKEEAP